MLYLGRPFSGIIIYTIFLLLSVVAIAAWQLFFLPLGFLLMVVTDTKNEYNKAILGIQSGFLD